MGWDGLIGAAAGYAIGGVPGMAAGAALGGTMDTNQANVDIAASNNQWSAAQYASRYQTTVKDMQAAGLNPMLAYSQGGGNPPTAQQVQFQNPMSSAVEAHNKASSSQVLNQQVANVAADTELKRDQAGVAKTQSAVNVQQAQLLAAQKEAALAQERLNTTSANEATVRMASQLIYGNPTQKALAASYWSQIQVNNANLPKIAQEIKTGGAYAAQAYAAAQKALAEKRITEQEFYVVKNAADYAKKTGLLDNSLRSISTAAGAARSLR